MNTASCRVGVLGPGIIGSVIAGRLHRAGHDVTLIGRGARLAALQAEGLALVDEQARPPEQARIVSRPVATDDLLNAAPFDWLLVCVRADQATAALERVQREDRSSHVVTLINHAEGLSAWQAIVGDRLLVGFPGISGYLEGNDVRYRLAPARVQPTTLGELSGERSERVLQIAALLEQAGIPTAVTGDIDAWLRFHVAWIHVLGLGLANAGGDLDRLIDDGPLRGRMVDAILEGLDIVEVLGFTMTPAGLRWFRRTPRALLAWAFKLMLGAKSTRAAFSTLREGQRLENVEMTRQMRALAAEAGLEAPVHAELASTVLSPPP